MSEPAKPPLFNFCDDAAGSFIYVSVFVGYFNGPEDVADPPEGAIMEHFNFGHVFL